MFDGQVNQRGRTLMVGLMKSLGQMLWWSGQPKESPSNALMVSRPNESKSTSRETQSEWVNQQCKKRSRGWIRSSTTKENVCRAIW
jgi:hypothetical protein